MYGQSSGKTEGEGNKLFKINISESILHTNNICTWNMFLFPITSLLKFCTFIACLPIQCTHTDSTILSKQIWMNIFFSDISTGIFQYVHSIPHLKTISTMQNWDFATLIYELFMISILSIYSSISHLLNGTKNV